MSNKLFFLIIICIIAVIFITGIICMTIIKRGVLI